MPLRLVFMRDSTSLRNSSLRTVSGFKFVHSVWRRLLYDLLGLTIKFSVENTLDAECRTMPFFIDNLKTIVIERMSVLEGTAHAYSHVDRVLRIATFLAKKEKANMELVQAGALLHDIGWPIGQPHNETGARLACEILNEMHYPAAKTERVARIVLLHPLDYRDRLKTLEEKIVWDADKIDLLGAVGIARGFHWQGKKPFEATVKLAYEVYTPIYNMLNTPTAKEIAIKRHEETMSFLAVLKKELSLSDLNLESNHCLVSL